MGRKPCFDKEDLKKGAWSSEEDEVFIHFVKLHGQGKWRSLAQKAGLNRSGKSCRLRWLNYLRPGIKRGDFSTDEEELIIKLHRLLGNRWALIAGRLPGRTDNDIKNYWNTILIKRVQGQKSDSIGQCQSEDMKDVQEFSLGIWQIPEQEQAKDDNVGSCRGQSTTPRMHVQDNNNSLISDAFNFDCWQENESPYLENGEKIIDPPLQHMELNKLASLLDIENELRELL